MRHHTALVTAVAALALAVPAAAMAAAPANYHYAPASVVQSVYLGTSAVPGACTVTLIAGHEANFRCPGATRHAAAGSCTLTVATAALWSYGCPDGKQGALKGPIPKSCKMVGESGYSWTFSCPRSAFGGSSTTAKTQSTGQIGTAAATSLSCVQAVLDGYISADRCSA